MTVTLVRTEICSAQVGIQICTKMKGTISQCSPGVIHISGYQFDTLKLPLHEEKEKKGKTDRQLILLSMLGYVVAGCNLYPRSHLCILLFTHHLKRSVFQFSDMDFEGISKVINTSGWEEICLFLLLKNSCFLYFINCNLFSFLNTTYKKGSMP